MYACCLVLTAAFVAVQLLFVRADWLYPAVCAGFILVSIVDLLLRRPRRVLLWLLLCLFYLRLPMVWNGYLAGGKSWTREFIDVFYVPVGCAVYWVARLREIGKARKA